MKPVRKIAIYSTNANHYSLIYIIERSLKHVFACEIDLFVTKSLSNMLEKERFHKVEYVDHSKFISLKTLNKLNKYDLIFVDELFSFRELLSFSFLRIRVPHLLLIHNCNTWFLPKKNRTTKLKSFIRMQMIGWIRKKFHYYAVAGWNMKDYVSSVLKIPNTIVIPFRYADYDEKIDTSKRDVSKTKLSICIPGMISRRRRYEDIIQILTDARLKNKIRIIFLGKPKGQYGEKIISVIKDKIEEGFDIKYWTDFIPENIFDEAIRDCDLLFSYFDPRYQTDNGQDEVYGVSKETGISLLMLNKAKPGILPAQYNQMDLIKNQTLFYDSFDQIPGIIENIYNNVIDLEDLNSNAIANAKSMDLALVGNEIYRIYNIQVDVS